MNYLNGVSYICVCMCIYDTYLCAFLNKVLEKSCGEVFVLVLHRATAVASTN